MYPPTTVVYPPDNSLSTLMLWCTPHTARITYFVYPNTPVYPIHLEYHPICLPCTPYAARITHLSTLTPRCTLSTSNITPFVYPVPHTLPVSPICLPKMRRVPPNCAYLSLCPPLPSWCTPYTAQYPTSARNALKRGKEEDSKGGPQAGAVDQLLARASPGTGTQMVKGGTKGSMRRRARGLSTPKGAEDCLRVDRKTAPAAPSLSASPPRPKAQMKAEREKEECGEPTRNAEQAAGGGLQSQG
ncbi:hypothetical protein C8F04DRAFT_1173254 [Mycena alexandri]|uniref:Uncharacterized protein n=1 Tax=Mycena alexandri TaxID=1745969 RepID=A0AAD6XBJ0_9AGAR|nr:hypothetical protein C8F04DRAFT_1173253 [Mycena alexandri]KAJ7046313.1 hypothetical protein C8F04DRAFT_1173254 [Mycena alexandri]